MIHPITEPELLDSAETVLVTVEAMRVEATVATRVGVTGSAGR